jgi:catechol 2,3-dioxygenase-like lactoylglutathione lyase family enzyme
MRVSHVCFVGVRTQGFDQMVHLFRDVLGMQVAFDSPGWSGFALSTGARDFVEVYSQAERDERLFPSSAQSPVVAFAVDDVVAARAELVAAGVEVIGEVAWADVVLGDPAYAGLGWCFFKGPDGNVYALQQDSADPPVAPST